MDGAKNTTSSAYLQSEYMLSLLLLGVLVILLVPLPPVILDMLLATNLAFSILLLLITLGVTEPLEISVFPSLLLLMTLGRLSLNVATTRLILLDGDAGRIVSTFGGFVVGGNIIVGLVIFLILIVIQFIVITKGASRVSEVAARFTLDALPGKQMAIDAEVGAGSIDENTAKARRDALTREAEFYGSMDGAGKFVRGDAIAGLVITGINLVGGVVLGMTNGIGIVEAIRRYSVLTVGDGLVSQIPALIIAVTAGILVTKATSKLSLGDEIGTQMLNNSNALLIGAVMLAVISLTPGLPKLPFLLLSGGLFYAWQQARNTAEDKQAKPEKPVLPKKQKTSAQQHLDQFLQTDRACVEIGLRLIPLVETRKGKNLGERIGTLRADLAQKYGIWIPSIRVRDNIDLSPDTYRILVNGHECATFALEVDDLLAINPGEARGDLPGTETIDPAFGLPAYWISPNTRQRAEIGGYTVVDSATVLITHLGEVLRKHAHELLSREDLSKLLDKLKETAPTVVEEIKPELIRMGDLHQLVTLLLEERVPITNLTRILESVVQHAHKVKSPLDLVEVVRAAISRDIVDRFRNEEGKVMAMICEPPLESTFRELMRDGALSLMPETLERLVGELNTQWQKAGASGHEVALLTDGSIRRAMRQTIGRALPELSVVAYHEIPSDAQISFAHIVKKESVFPSDGAKVKSDEMESAA